jgi:hypothetical protein
MQCNEARRSYSIVLCVWSALLLRFERTQIINFIFLRKLSKKTKVQFKIIVITDISKKKIKKKKKKKNILHVPCCTLR